MDSQGRGGSMHDAACRAQLSNARGGHKRYQGSDCRSRPAVTPHQCCLLRAERLDDLCNGLRVDACLGERQNHGHIVPGEAG